MAFIFPDNRFGRLLARREEIAYELAQWRRDWAEHFEQEIGIGDPFAILPSIEQHAAEIAAAIDATYDADHAAFEASGLTLEEWVKRASSAPEASAPVNGTAPESPATLHGRG